MYLGRKMLLQTLVPENIMFDHFDVDFEQKRYKPPGTDQWNSWNT